MPDTAIQAADARVRLTVNGRPLDYDGPPLARLTQVLRDCFGLTGTKVGCDAGDCGACTIRLDARLTCACMVPAARAAGCTIVTVEGLAADPLGARLQHAFLAHGAAQCGICTPGMLMAAFDLLQRQTEPTRQQVLDALGGVLCRCTGYQHIVDAVLAAAADAAIEIDAPQAGAAVGARAVRVDGLTKVHGAERFGADAVPADALWLRVVRSPHHAASFVLGDLEAWCRGHPGIAAALSARDVPFNGFGIYPDIKDQPVLADGLVRYCGEAVVALVGEAAALAAIRDTDLPIVWQPFEPVVGIAAATAPGARRIQADRPDNLLVRGRVQRGDPVAAFGASAARVHLTVETSFVEHAYIEPEAGWARRVGNRIEVHVSTQTPYMDRDETASVLRLPVSGVRIVPTACGGGFGGKLDQSVQPLVALAAWRLRRPVACVYTRPESMAATTKRHPARIDARFGCDATGRLLACEVVADFDTGAYASWGPTVAGRVPVHASGPYAIANVAVHSAAWLSNGPPAGAFRGFGVPQAAIAHEAAMDALADRVGLDRLEFRLRNALRAGDTTPTGQKLRHSAGLPACLEALRPHWQEAQRAVAGFDRANGALRRGVGIGCMWYGIGNTSMSNPSTMRITLASDGTITLHSGALDIGQGSDTIMAQIAADALGVPLASIRLVTGDTDLTPDAGKTSASRQTFVSGKAVQLAATALRGNILRLANAGAAARLAIDGSALRIADGDIVRTVDLASLPASKDGVVLAGEGTFDPPTTRLDADGQGTPYASYAFAAQIAIVEVDVRLGTVRVLRIVAAHDVGRAINPLQVEGQIHGGIAQGLGLALMEEYVPGRTENLHDYLIPTVGDMPQIDTILIEDPDPLGPSGAKGVGEPGLVPTAPAILGAIEHACGVRMLRVPGLPHRLLAALQSQQGTGGGTS